jgi:hypothetical protein
MKLGTNGFARMVTEIAQQTGFKTCAESNEAGCQQDLHQTRHVARECIRQSNEPLLQTCGLQYTP